MEQTDHSNKKIRVCTYADPFLINRNKELWELITKYPHFCASETLVQGMTIKYGRREFAYLRSLESFMKRFYRGFYDNPQYEMQLFLTVSDIIREMDEKNPEINMAFRFNIREVVESIKTLIFLKAKYECFPENLPKEQDELLIIYKQVLKSGYYLKFLELSTLTKDDFKIAVIETIIDEIKNTYETKGYISQLGKKFPPISKEDGLECISVIIGILSENTQTSDFKDNNNYAEDLRNAKHLEYLLLNYEKDNFDKIIIHGVHRITPMMFLMVNQLKDLGIEVIFLINYCKNLPATYKTWDEVYEWTGATFEYAENIDLNMGNKLGKSMALVMEGCDKDNDIDNKIIKFKNLTSFTDKEVSKNFKDAKEKLAKMKTQYYAVKGDSCNEILKVYYPIQFGEKHFLSYPIGQFILGIYSMWDFNTNSLVINEKYLLECAVAGLYKTSESTELFNVINKIILYFSDIETINDYYKRIEQLKKNIILINKKEDYKPLKKLSFFNVSIMEVEFFKGFLEFIEEIAKSLFENSTRTIDFAKHFRKLMEIIANKSNEDVLISDTERSLIRELTKKIAEYKDEGLKGNIEDVKEAISYYLAGANKKNSSNWIVRDFEQLDGAVLLSEKTKATKYHFALLSNNNMNKYNKEELSWPITESMFNSYYEFNSAIRVIAKGIFEKKNFLKFSLFYGIFFSRVNFEVSYIEVEDDKKQTPYYIFEALNFQPSTFEDTIPLRFINDSENNDFPKLFNPEKLLKEEREIFSICPYKYFMHSVIKSEICYKSDFHIKYFVTNFINMLTSIKYLEKSPEQIRAKIQEELIEIKRIFPYWNEITFFDVITSAEKKIFEGKAKRNSISKEHISRKENFLIAQWDESMIFNKPELNKKIIDYMESSNLYPNRNDLPSEKVCMNCNFNDLCLRSLYEALSDQEEEPEYV